MNLLMDEVIHAELKQTREKDSETGRERDGKREREKAWGKNSYTRRIDRQIYYYFNT